MSFPAPSRLRKSTGKMLRSVISTWFGIAGLLLIFGYAAHLLHRFDERIVTHWLWLAPVLQIAGHFSMRAAAPLLISLWGGRKRVVVAGLNEQGLALVERIGGNRYSGMDVSAFSRTGVSIACPEHRHVVLGTLAEMPMFVKNGGIDVIYLSLPMAMQPRIRDLLDALRDTTASIYFVPDIFVTDLIQGRMDVIDDMPVVAVCESPFTGLTAG